MIPQENPTGYRAITRHADIKRISRDPQDLLVRRGRGGRRSAGAPGGHAVLHRDGRSPPHEAARAGVVRVHAAAGGPDRGGHPAGGQGDRDGGRADRGRRLRVADRQAAPAPDDLGHDRRAGRRPGAGGGRRRHDRLGRATSSSSTGAIRWPRSGQAIWTLSQAASEMAAHREKHPARRPDDRARAGGDRRGAPHPRRDLGLVRAALGGRQRHHAPHHLARHARAHPLPGPARAAAGGPGRAAPDRRRGVRALGHAGAALPQDGHPAGGALRRADRARREGRDVLPLGQPRRDRDRRSLRAST